MIGMTHFGVELTFHSSDHMAEFMSDLMLLKLKGETQ